MVKALVTCVVCAPALPPEPRPQSEEGEHAPCQEQGAPLHGHDGPGLEAHPEAALVASLRLALGLGAPRHLEDKDSYRRLHSY